MEQQYFTSWTTFLGLLLILLGLAVIAIPFLARYFTDIEKIHPLILIGYRTDGLFIGTSPILIIALLLIYLFIRALS